MEIRKQDQNVSDGGQAIQSGRDTVINQGMSLTQMEEVLNYIAVKHERFTQEAWAKVDARMGEFQEAVLKQFEDTTKTNSEAFRDPDFQFLLGGAQEAYARSGDPAVKDTLADIIARRSLAPNASREALTLNDAAVRAPKLTNAEYAALSLCYMVKYTTTALNTAQAMADYINNKLLPFARDVSSEQASFWHIEAQGCGSWVIGEVDVRNVLRISHAGLLGTGLSLPEYQQGIPASKQGALHHVLCPAVRNPNNLQPKATTLEVFLGQYGHFGLDETELRMLWSRFEATISADIAGTLRPLSPDIDLLFKAWNETPIKSLQLNSVGIAIAHANAVRVVDFDAPLNIWIK